MTFSLTTLIVWILIAALVGIIWDYARTRSQVRAQAAAITGGDPNRGEALFIEYGCGSCHAVQNVRTATARPSRRWPSDCRPTRSMKQWACWCAGS